MKNKIFITCLFLIGCLNLFSQKENKFIREGNKLYRDGKFSEAEIQYNQALKQNEKSFPSSFNQADALYKQEKYEDAAKKFESLSSLTDDKTIKSKVFHNLGNSYLKSQKFEQSIKAYKEALKNNPKDEESRYNLMYAMQMLKKQQEQNKQNKQDQNKQEDKKDSEKKDQKDSQKPDNQNKEDQKKENQKQEQQPQPNQLSKEDAKRLLEAQNKEEKNVQEKLNKQKVKVNVQIEKDW